MSAELSETQIERYSRQIILPEVGGKGQKRIAQAKVFLAGAGGLGSPCAYYLTAAGIGHIAVVDSDDVELNNLQRQILHTTSSVGKPKAESARATLNALNPEVEIIPIKARLASNNVLNMLKDYDIVVDGSDNFPTRYLINDACVILNKPLVHGGIFRFDGQAFTIVPHKGPCYRCLFSEPPPPGVIPSCQEAGILGVVAGIIGLVQANEVIKYILGKGELLIGRLLIFNALNSSFREVKIRRDTGCPVCGDSPTIKELIDYEQFCGVSLKEE